MKSKLKLRSILGAYFQKKSILSTSLVLSSVSFLDFLMGGFMLVFLTDLMGAPRDVRLVVPLTPMFELLLCLSTVPVELVLDFFIVRKDILYLF